MNLLSLISPWLDIICQVTTKCATVPKSKLFRELNRAMFYALLFFICVLRFTLAATGQENDMPCMNFLSLFEIGNQAMKKVLKL